MTDLTKRDELEDLEAALLDMPQVVYGLIQLLELVGHFMSMRGMRRTFSSASHTCSATH